VGVCCFFCFYSTKEEKKIEHEAKPPIKLQIEGVENRAFDTLKKFQILLKNLGGWVGGCL
jgi:hypothetical protein